MAPLNSFKAFLREGAEGKLLHLTHLEDSIIIDGSAGVKNAINFLKGVSGMLSGSANKSVNITVKWDGAPAIVSGIDPSTNKFFVGTKSVFTKTPKINFTNADIAKNHGSGELANKLKIALKELPKLGNIGVMQGDMMYTKNDLKKQTIDGVDFVTFRPNTILYAFAVDSDVGKQILASEIGIIFHTTYTGSSLADAKAKFTVNTKALKKTKTVWFDNASFKDLTGTASFTKSEEAEVTKQIKNVEFHSTKVNSSFLNSISKQSDNGGLGVFETVQWFINQTVRKGELITDFSSWLKEFEMVYKSKVQKKIDSVKKDDAKQRWVDVQNRGLAFIKTNKKDFIATMQLHTAVTIAKNLMVNKLDKLQKVKTFIPFPDGLKLTGAEGFVAISGGKAFKFVDRLEFSRANFTVAKDWEKGPALKVPESEL